MGSMACLDGRGVLALEASAAASHFVADDRRMLAALDKQY